MDGIDARYKNETGSQAIGQKLGKIKTVKDEPDPTDSRQSPSTFSSH